MAGGFSSGQSLRIPTLRPSAPTLVERWSSHCCMFALIITCDVRNTMGQAESTGFVMQGSAAAKTQSWKRDRAEMQRGKREKGTERTGRSVPQQASCFLNTISDIVVLTVQTHAVQPNFVQIHRTFFWIVVEILHFLKFRIIPFSRGQKTRRGTGKQLTSKCEWYWYCVNRKHHRDKMLNVETRIFHCLFVFYWFWS